MLTLRLCLGASVSVLAASVLVLRVDVSVLGASVLVLRVAVSLTTLLSKCSVVYSSVLIVEVFSRSCLIIQEKAGKFKIKCKMVVSRLY